MPGRGFPLVIVCLGTRNLGLLYSDHSPDSRLGDGLYGQENARLPCFSPVLKRVCHVLYDHSPHVLPPRDAKWMHTGSEKGEEFSAEPCMGLWSILYDQEYITSQ